MCCGKTGLKSTVALSINEGEAVYYGVTCAARALKIEAKDVRKGARDADAAKLRAENAARAAKFDAETKPWFLFLATNGKGTDNFSRIESLGGFKAARALYRAATS